MKEDPQQSLARRFPGTFVSAPDETPQMKVVKFRWRNAHGWWAPPDFKLALIESDYQQFRSSAVINRPSLTDLEVLEEEPLPEWMRRYGRAPLALSQVKLHDEGVDELSVAEVLQHMARQLDCEHPHMGAAGRCLDCGEQVSG